MKNQKIQLSFYLLFLALLPLSTLARPFILVLIQDDLSDPTATHNPSSLDDFVVNSLDFDDFPDFESRTDSVIDPGSWSPVLESEMDEANNALINSELIYYSAVRLMVEAASRGEYRLMEEAVSEIDATSTGGDPHAQSVMGFFYNTGMTREKNKAKGFLYHYFAAQGGNMQSKMVLAYTNYSQEAKEYFEKAAENEDSGGFYNLGVMYLKGLGVKRDLKVACNYFALATNAGQPKAFYQLAKMFHTGVGLKKNIPMATALYKLVAERGPWSSLSRWALESYLKGDISRSFLSYSKLAEMGYEIAQSNAAWILDKYGEQSVCMGESGICTDEERHKHAHDLWWQASEQGNEHAALLVGDAYFYGRGTERDYDRAAEAYMHAKSQANAQAIFNLGYMHEHGQGLPFDLHLAKRYYDQALEVDPAAKLPVTLALASLWVRKNYADSLLVHVIDSLPNGYPKVEAWVENVIMDEGNATILTLFVCLLTVLYLRERQRRHGAAAAMAPPHQPVEQGAPVII